MMGFFYLFILGAFEDYPAKEQFSFYKQLRKSETNMVLKANTSAMSDYDSNTNLSSRVQ